MTRCPLVETDVPYFKLIITDTGTKLAELSVVLAVSVSEVVVVVALSVPPVVVVGVSSSVALLVSSSLLLLLLAAPVVTDADNSWTCWEDRMV